MAVTSISVYGITLAGWSSNNKYAMLGGLRSTAQMISYELALGLCLHRPDPAGRLDEPGGHRQRADEACWFIFYQPLARASSYLIATLAEVNRAPFDMPEAEQELTAGYHTEYSGMKFALFFMAEYIKMIAVSMIGATLFLGGYHCPFVDQIPVIGPIWARSYLLAKTVVMLVRDHLDPRHPAAHPLRPPDGFGWKVLFPLALLNVLVTAVVVLLV